MSKLHVWASLPMFLECSLFVKNSSGMSVPLLSLPDLMINCEDVGDLRNSSMFLKY